MWLDLKVTEVFDNNLGDFFSNHFVFVKIIDKSDSTLHFASSFFDEN